MRAGSFIFASPSSAACVSVPQNLSFSEQFWSTFHMSKHLQVLQRSVAVNEESAAPLCM